MAVGDRFGAFIPTTDIFNVENFVDLRRILNSMALMINTKESGIYSKTEFVSGKVWYPDPALSSQTAKAPIPRPVYRKTIDFGALPNTGTKSVAHGITFPTPDTFTSIDIIASSTDPTSGIRVKLPHASTTLANNIEIYYDRTNIVVITGSNRSAFTETYVTLELIKE